MSKYKVFKAPHYKDRFNWEPDSRALQPTQYVDQTFSYVELHGTTREELDARNNAPRLSPSFQTHKKSTVEFTKTSIEANPNGIDDKSGLRSKAEASESKLPVTKAGIATVQKLYPSGGGASDPVLRSSKPGIETTPLHDLCASERLLTLTGLSGTLKRNPLACYQTDSHHRTPLHWLMLNPKLNMSMLHEFLNFNNNACTPGLRIVDRHGENNAFNYFLDSHIRIGYKEWKKCLDYLAEHHIAGEILHEVDPFYLVGVKSKGNHLSGTILMKLGGRVPKIRCDAPEERQHLQGNPQMMSNQMREDRTKDHPDEVRGFELRKSSQGYQKTIVGGVIGKQKIYL